MIPQCSFFHRIPQRCSIFWAYKADLQCTFIYYFGFISATVPSRFLLPFLSLFAGTWQGQPAVLMKGRLAVADFGRGARWRHMGAAARGKGREP